MIADDMITFVRNDLIVFGIGVAVFLVIVLSLIFREVRWVALPLVGCVYAGLLMIGMLGLVGWKVTVISSNFLALMLIITISMNIHLTVRYRQLHRDFPELSHRDLVAATVRRMVWPCLYTALTTIIGFGSLVFSGIKPVIDFGWMMSIGLAVTFVTAFSLFPAIVLLLGRAPRQDHSGAGPRHRHPRLHHSRTYSGAGGATKRADAEGTFTRGVTRGLALAAERRGGWVLAAAGVLVVVGALGASRLTVENSFVDYFSDDTEIYRGLALIDRELGGTTPLEVVLDLDEDRIFDDEPAPKPTEYDAEAEREKAGYWFTEFKIERIKEVHDWLASQPEVGKVLSLASLVRVGEKLNDGEPLDSLRLALVYRRVPEDLKRSLIDPYIDILWDEARISLRIRDTLPDLHRKELLDRIRAGLRDELELGPEDVTVSGLLVLYNNMLQSLFTSQISTLGAVLAGVALMLLLLFRSLSLAVLGIVPNLLAAGAVLGTMGLLSIPLDFMTITVAAVTIGIAVDNAIHYIYRFREEFARCGDYVATMHVCHANIGKAVFYTSATIIFGFSILVLSNFLPTIYFGLLTGLAMTIALLAALTLLPKLILVTKPFGAG
ncbi:MAG: MMPL family transporter [Gammaproteobacteria bacterium]|nr:MMPL family transporter [Gammaproteobacteria bacterium]